MDNPKDHKEYSQLSDEQDSSKYAKNLSPTKESLKEALLDYDTPIKISAHSIEMTQFHKNEGYTVFDNERKPSFQFFLNSSAGLTFYSLLGTLQIIISYILTDMRKKPRSFKIGVFSIFIVVAFLIVLQSAKQLTPALFIRLSEGEAGDADLILRAVALENDTRLTNESYISNPIHEVRLLNGVNIERVCDMIEEAEGCSGRWMLIGKTQNLNRSIQTFVIIIDSQKEISIGLGRNSKANAGKLNGNECYLTESTKRALEIESDSVELNIDILKSLVSQESLALGLTENNNEKLTQEEKLENIKKQLKTRINETIDSGMPNFTISNISGLFGPLIENPTFLLLASFLEELGFSENLTENRDQIIKIIDLAIDSLIETLNLTLTLKIKANVKSPRGKWPSVMGNVVVLDYQYMTQAFLQGFVYSFKDKISKDLNWSMFSLFIDDKTLDDGIKKLALSSGFNLKRFAMMEYLTLKDKLGSYEDEKKIDLKMVEFSNILSKKLGKNYTIQANVPLSGVIKKMSVIKGFLDNVFGSSVFLLLLLSVLLIYSLMLSNVEEKTFEFGMLRALGFNKTHMIWLLVIQALLYAFIGMFLAFLFGFLLNVIICYIIYDYSLLGAGYVPTELSLILGFSVGLIMPVLSNIMPIMRALSKTLRDSLDLFHREINIFRVRVMKLEKLGVSLYQTLNGSVMVFMGIASYYLAPKAFIMQELTLFLAIMNVILVIFLLGLTVLLNLLESYLEQIMLKIILCFMINDKKLQPIILKNIKGHHSRNLKTALMFSINMSFLIFAGTGFKLQQSVINDSFRVFIGTDMSAEIPANSKVGLDEFKIRMFLETYKSKNPDQIASYSFVSIPFDQMPHVRFPKVSPLTAYPLKRTAIKAIEDNFLDSVFTEYFLPIEFDERLQYNTLPDGKRDCVRAINDPRNTEFYSRIHDVFNVSSNNLMRNESNSEKKMKILRFLVPEGDRFLFGVEPNIPGIIYLDNVKYPSKVATMIAKMPGFGMTFSSYRTAGKIMFTSMENFRFLINEEYEHFGINETVDEFFAKNPKNMTYNILKEKVFIKFARPLTPTERNELSNGLRNQFTDMLTMLYDTQDFLDDTADAFFYLDIFYYVVALISIILSFFLILVSFNSNVKDHVWEFGILRALGLNKSQMTKIYIYEAVCLTMASGVIGTVVGVVVALVLTVQYITFAEIPLKFHFPGVAFGVTFVSGVVTAILGSFLALREIRDRSISNIMKGLG